MTAFIIWSAIGILFIILGITCFFAKRAVGFWANTSVPEIKEIKPYNYAVGKLWIVFGFVMILLGIPLLYGQNSPYIFITVIGLMYEVIGIAIVYSRIEKKYRKK